MPKFACQLCGTADRENTLGMKRSRSLRYSAKAFLAAVFVQATTWPSGGHAQSIYRCGNTYSTAPCDNGKQIEAARQAVTRPDDDSVEDHVCAKSLKAFVAFKDPDSVKIESVTRTPRWELIEVGAQKVAVKVFYLWVNAKNSYGGYTGAKMYSCYVSEGSGKVLKVVSPRE